MAVSVTFGAYDFGTTAEKYAIRQRPRVKQILIPRRDGVRADIALLGPLEVTLSGKIFKSSNTLLRTEFDALKAALFKTRDKLTLFDDRFIDCQLTSYGDDFVAGSGMLAARYDLAFIGELPFLQSVALNSNSQTVSVSPTQWTVTPGGSIRTRPTLRITNNSGADIVNNLKIENLTLSKALVFTGTLKNANTLIIDMQARSIQNAGVEDLTNWQGEFWELAVGANILKYTGGITVAVVTEWRDRYV